MGWLKRLLGNTTTLYLLAMLFGYLLGRLLPQHNDFLKMGVDFAINAYQIPVIPFIVVNIICAIGKLEAIHAKRLLTYVIIGVLACWAVLDSIIYACSFLFSQQNGTAQLLPAIEQTAKHINLLDVIVPSNIFHALENGYVPGIVIFSFVMGYLLMSLPNKQKLLKPMNTALELLHKVVKLLGKIAPLAMFIMVADFFNNNNITALYSVSLYILAFAFYTAMLFLFLTPLVLKSLTNVSIRCFYRHAREALVIAFIIRSPLVALPMMIIGLRAMLDESYPKGKDYDKEQVMIPIIYNFPLAGKLSVLIFISFAAYLYQTAMPVGRLLQQYILGPISQFSSTWQSLPFLLTLLHIPLDAFKLFPSMTVITRYMSTPSEILITLLLGLLLVLFLERAERLSLFRIGRTLAIFFIGLVLLSGVGYGLSHLIHVPGLKPPTEKHLNKVFFNLGQQQPGEKQEFASPYTPRYRASFSRIMETRTLRVGYNPEAAPFCYFYKHRLVGYDISIVEHLANELGVKIVYYPYQYNNLANAINQGRFDVAVCGITMTANRLAQVGFSMPLYQAKTALIVKDYQQKHFRYLRPLLKQATFTLAARQGGASFNLAKELFPNANVVTIPSLNAIPENAQINATLTDQISALKWTLLNPYYATIIPKPSLGEQRFAWAVGLDRKVFLHYLNYWLRLNTPLIKTQQRLWLDKLLKEG